MPRYPREILVVPVQKCKLVSKLIMDNNIITLDTNKSVILDRQDVKRLERVAKYGEVSNYYKVYKKPMFNSSWVINRIKEMDKFKDCYVELLTSPIDPYNSGCNIRYTTSKYYRYGKISWKYSKVILKYPDNKTPLPKDSHMYTVMRDYYYKVIAEEDVSFGSSIEKKFSIGNYKLTSRDSIIIPNIPKRLVDFCYDKDTLVNYVPNIFSVEPKDDEFFLLSTSPIKRNL